MYPSSHFEMIPFIEPPSYLEFEDNYMNPLRRQSMAEQTYPRDSNPNYPGVNFGFEENSFNFTDYNENHLNRLTDLKNKYKTASLNPAFSTFQFIDEHSFEALNSNTLNSMSSNTNLLSRRKSVPNLPIPSFETSNSNKVRQDSNSLQRKLSNCTAALRSRQRKSSWVEETTINLNRLRKENKVLCGQIECLQKESFLIHSILNASCSNGLDSLRNQLNLPSEVQHLPAEDLESKTTFQISSGLIDPPKAVLLDCSGFTPPGKEIHIQTEELNVSSFKLTSRPFNP